ESRSCGSNCRIPMCSSRPERAHETRQERASCRCGVGRGAEAGPALVQREDRSRSQQNRVDERGGQSRAGARSCDWREVADRADHRQGRRRVVLHRMADRRRRWARHQGGGRVRREIGVDAVTLESTTKIGLYLGLLLAIGAVSAYWWVLRRTRVDSDAPWRIDVESRLRVIGLCASSIAATALAARAWAHTASVFGFGDSWSLHALRAIVVESRWGHGWRWQLVGALGCLVLFGAAAGSSRSVWAAVACAVVAFAWTVTMTGHASGAAGRMTLHA